MDYTHSNNYSCYEALSNGGRPFWTILTFEVLECNYSCYEALSNSGRLPGTHGLLRDGGKPLASLQTV